MLPPPWQNVLGHPLVGVKEKKKGHFFVLIDRGIINCTGRRQKILISPLKS